MFGALLAGCLGMGLRLDGRATCWIEDLCYSYNEATATGVGVSRASSQKNTKE